MTRWPAATPTRRRFVAIAAAAAGLPFAAIRAGAETTHLHRWSGIALGAAAEIVLHDPDAARARRLIARCVAEIDRLEDVFSLYRPQSAISRLNREGRLAAPPLELVALLAEARSYSERTEGAFDVTVQPLWRLYAAHFARSRRRSTRGPAEAEHAERAGAGGLPRRRDRACRGPLRPAGHGDHPQRHCPGLHHRPRGGPAAGRRHGRRSPRHRRSPRARPSSRRAALACRPPPRGRARDRRAHRHADRPRRCHLGRHREPLRCERAPPSPVRPRDRQARAGSGAGLGDRAPRHHGRRAFHRARRLPARASRRFRRPLPAIEVLADTVGRPS